MLKSNLIYIISNLNQKEFRDFGEFVISPFFNKNPKVIKLYDYISRYYPDFSEKHFDKKIVFNELFPGEEYNGGLLKTIIFKLTSLSKEYLSFLNYSKNDFLTDEHFLYEIVDRNLNRIFDKHLKVMRKSIESQPERGADYFFQKYIVDEQDAVFILKQYKIFSARDVPSDTINSTEVNFMIFVAITLLKRYRYYLGQKFTTKINYNFGFLEGIIDYLNNVVPGESVLLEVLYSNIKLLRNEDNEDEFYKLKELIHVNLKQINREEIYNSLTTLHNFCVRKYRAGFVNFEHELFLISEFMIQNNFLTFDDSTYLAPILFRNIILNGLRLREYEWTRNFIETYSKKLSPEQKENTYNFALSRLYLAEKDLERSLQLLSKVKPDDLFYKMAIKQDQTMLYYELGLYQESLDLLDNFKHLLNNEFFSEAHIKMNNDYISLMRKLLKLKTGSKTYSADDLKKIASQVKDLPGREWFNEKLSEFKDG